MTSGTSPPPSLFILDDDVGFVHAAAELARARGFVITVAGTLEQARARLATQRFDVALLDLGLPDGNGLDLLGELDLERTQVILVTGRPTLDSALQALRAPVVDYVVKPLYTAQYTALLDRSLARRPLPPLAPGETWHGVGGGSPALGEVVRQAQRVAPTAAAVHLVGETGVGKQLLAAAIHADSGRRGPFVTVDCSALPADALADALFGHERGVAGAHARQPGAFEQARGGTLFLAHVAALPEELQAPLLHVLASRTLRRRGGGEDVPVDVRVISAAHPAHAAAGGDEARTDLYWRLAEFVLPVPPLRERPEDIAELALLFLDRLNQRHGVQRTLAQDGADRLRAHAWPGNVRELRHCMQRAFLLAEGDVVRPAPDVAPATSAPLAESDGSITFAIGTPMHEVERRLLFKTLAYFGNNKARTAQALGITTKTIYNRLQAYRAAGHGDVAGNDPDPGHDDA